jgi:hypothetical protein
MINIKNNSIFTSIYKLIISIIMMLIIVRIIVMDHQTQWNQTVTKHLNGKIHQQKMVNKSGINHQ